MPRPHLIPALLLGLLTVAGHAQDPGDDRPLKIFVEDIAPLYRPSYAEEPMRALVLAEVEKARLNPAWGGRVIEELRDEAGNQLVRLPGTGRFANSTEYTALQAHHDMVIAVSDRNADAAAMLTRGIDLVRTGSWCHSRNHATTTGADNGLGVAAQIAFIREPAFEHGPLELLFTVQEEQGMVGARNLGFTLKSKRLINLDNETHGELGYGCLGGRRVAIEAELGTAPLSDDHTVVQVTITKLPFGHSGAEIHEPRANAITFAATILSRLLATEPETRVISARSAAKTALNTIPGHIQLTLATRRPAEVILTLRTLVREMRDKIPGARTARLLVERSDKTPTRALGIVPAGSLFAQLADVPNGVLRRDPAFPNGVKTSSSLGFLDVTESGRVELAYMTRSYESADIDLTDRLLRFYWMSNGAMAETARAELISESPPWLSAEDSPLTRAAMRANPKLRKVLVAGGLEAALLGVPDTISIGPTIKGPHSPEERFDVDTVPEFFALLRKILIEAAGCESSLVSTP